MGDQEGPGLGCLRLSRVLKASGAVGRMIRIDDRPWQCCRRPTGVRTGKVARYWKPSAQPDYTSSRLIGRGRVAAGGAGCTDADNRACDDDDEKEEDEEGRAGMRRLEGL